MQIEKITRALQQSEILNSREAFDQYTANLEMHVRIVNSLLERLSGTSKLVFYTFHAEQGCSQLTNASYSTC